MARTILYIAASLDGYIAKPDGDLDWLTSFPNPENEDFGYNKLLTEIEVIIMGRATYEALTKMEIAWPYPAYKTFVVSNNPMQLITTANTYLITSGLNNFMTEIRNQSNKDIWLVGGGKLIRSLLNYDQIDRIILTIVPTILGSGIPLFSDEMKHSNWKFIHSESYSNGLVKITYDLKK